MEAFAHMDRGSLSNRRSELREARDTAFALELTVQCIGGSTRICTPVIALRVLERVSPHIKRAGEFERERVPLRVRQVENYGDMVRIRSAARNQIYLAWVRKRIGE